MRTAAARDVDARFEVKVLHISSRLKCWQLLRVEKFERGMNAIVELKEGLDFIPRFLGMTPRRVILSMLPERSEPFCVMIDGDAASQQWFSDINEAVLATIALI